MEPFLSVLLVLGAVELDKQGCHVVLAQWLGNVSGNQFVEQLLKCQEIVLLLETFLLNEHLHDCFRLLTVLPYSVACDQNEVIPWTLGKYLDVRFACDYLLFPFQMSVLFHVEVPKCS
jgi:hypothetical protein